ncbi:MAG TPA: methionine--tRNA ligase [Candidatus Paceibacterota bacterium]|nr:methionine--tRNA ligase [Candidatus Paceibacterota bacterium]
MINIDDFKKVEMTVGKIISAEPVPDTDKLLRLVVNFGALGERQVVSGIALKVSLESLPGTKAVFVTNLEPRTLRGLESQAMILAASLETPATETIEAQSLFSIIGPLTDIPEGTRVG